MQRRVRLGADRGGSSGEDGQGAYMADVSRIELRPIPMAEEGVETCMSGRKDDW